MLKTSDGVTYSDNTESKDQWKSSPGLYYQSECLSAREKGRLDIIYTRRCVILTSQRVSTDSLYPNHEYIITPHGSAVH